MIEKLTNTLDRQQRWRDRQAAGVSARPTVSIQEACRIVGVSRRTIYNWLDAGKVEYARTAGGSVRIFEDTLWRPSSDKLRMAKASLGTETP